LPTRELYQVTATDVPGLVRELNFIFQRLADRLDKLEGIRGGSDLTVNGDVTVNDDSDEVIHSLE
jgi:hypothetical protein